jgi:hypothetical protein
MTRIGKFQWDDGGRATSGYVGITGDCVTRSIAIATGLAYRDVYKTLTERYGSTPRDGVPRSIYAPYLEELGWKEQPLSPVAIPLELYDFESGITLVLCQDQFGRRSHLCTISDGVLYDTWDPCDDDGAYRVVRCWRASDTAVCSARLGAGVTEVRHAGDLTQSEFEKIIQRLRAIDNTARNQASTESERENALRMMQSLLLRHNLSREDLASDEAVDSTMYARVACPVNGSKSLIWEKVLATYVAEHIFPMVQWYSGRKVHRTIFFFYGPRTDVENSVQLFRELLLTIASAAKILYGGYSRGSGASYAEGYVASLPKSTAFGDPQQDQDAPTNEATSQALMQKRSLLVHERSSDWLFAECGIRLVTTRRKLRDFRDPAAEQVGRKHGSEHRIDLPTAPKRLN